MSADRQQAIEYFRAPANGLWRWAEAGSVLVWHDGSTLAFREEVTQILEWLAPHGLPPFGSLVFLLAACRGKVPETGDILGERAGKRKGAAPLPGPLPAPLSRGEGEDRVAGTGGGSSPAVGSKAAMFTVARRQLTAQLEAALAELTKVAQLPAELNSGLKAKCVLAEAAFEPTKVERYADARAILRGWRQPLNDVDLIDPERTGVGGGYVRQIHIVAEGLKLHTVESLTLRLRTGLDALPQEAEVSLPPAERARQLIEELSRDRELGAVGRAAAELLAAVRLPRRLGEREQLAIGGVADITNRGPLDRLLLSELAHDDLTLAVRVALNEALYLRREPPMREPPGMLAVLLDSGVRLWGTPRILAAAVALALVARDKHHTQTLVWRAQGRQLLPVDLLSRRGLTEHLAALETDAHPGAALAAFADAIPAGTQHQSVLITHRDALDDPEFRRALAEQRVGPGFVALADRDGKFELHALPFVRRQPLCEAELDLAAIFAEPPGVPLLDRQSDPELPAIFRAATFPFLLPVNGRADFWIKADDGFTYAALNDRRLVRFGDLRKGGRVLAGDLPGGRAVWMGCVGGTLHLVKSGSSQRPARLISLPLPDGPLRVVDLFSGLELQAVHQCGEVILVIRSHDVRAYALSDGRLLGQAPNPHSWVRGRYLEGFNQFYFVAWDGEKVKFEPLNLHGERHGEVVLTVFDRDQSEGPWFLDAYGNVVSSADGTAVKLKHPLGGKLDFHTVNVSRDGHRLFVGYKQYGAAKPSGCLFDLTDGRSFDPLRNPHPDFEPSPQLPTWNLYRVVESIAALPDGLAICGRRERWRKITLVQDNSLRILDQTAPLNDLRQQVSFAGQPKPTKRGCSLQLAEWPNGSKAFLDSRGLLHLKSHDPAVPEISLVLADGEAAGWTSDGHACGPPFFFEGPRPDGAAQVFERLLQFLARL